MIDRRTFLAGLGAGLLAAPFAAEAQLARSYRVVYVNSASETEERKPHLRALRSALRELGYVEGKNLMFEARFADGNVGRVPTLVDDVIALKPNVLLGFEDVAQVMRSKTTSIPIVLTGALDPIGAGLAQSLARPGLNVTGSTQLNDQLVAKHVQILREIVPRLGRIGQFVDTAAPGCKLVAEYARDAAQSVGVSFVPYSVTTLKDIELAFSRIRSEHVEALLPCPSPVMFSARSLLFAEAQRLRVPLTSFVVANVPPGVLFAYAATVVEGYRRAATYVDKILKTAKALGLTIPPSLLQRADEIIQ